MPLQPFFFVPILKNWMVEDSRALRREMAAGVRESTALRFRMGALRTTAPVWRDMGDVANRRTGEYGGCNAVIRSCCDSVMSFVLNM